MQNAIAADKCVEGIVGKRQILRVAALKLRGWRKLAGEFDEVRKIETDRFGAALGRGIRQLPGPQQTSSTRMPARTFAASSIGSTVCRDTIPRPP